VWEKLASMKNPFRALKVLTRANAVHDVLNEGARRPERYRDAALYRRGLTAVAALVEVLPLPPVWRVAIMGVLKGALKNWKTSLIGIGAGAGIAFLAAVQSGLSPKDALMAAAVAALGLAAKDGDQTGVAK